MEFFCMLTALTMIFTGALIIRKLEGPVKELEEAHEDLQKQIRELPTLNQLRDEQRQEFFLAENMREVNLFLAPYTEPDGETFDIGCGTCDAMLMDTNDVAFDLAGWTLVGKLTRCNTCFDRLKREVGQHV